MRLLIITLVTTFLLTLVGSTAAQKKPAGEDDFYRMITIPLPEDVVLEVGGLEWLDKDRNRLLACTRRGEIWLIDNPYADSPTLPAVPAKDLKKADKTAIPPDPANIVRFTRMLFGLHEPLGLLKQPDGIYLAQRAEVTRLKDLNKDDRFDLVETFCDDWEISGSYHEYAFGPELDGKGNMWVTLNRPFDAEPEGHAHWRGWAMQIDRQGKMHPICMGLRSPAGLGANAEGDMFYTDNQGDWVAVCKLGHLKPGVYHGNPTGISSCKHPLSPMKDPGKLPNGFPLAEAKKQLPVLQLPAVWFPYPSMGRSHSDVLCDDTGGKFGPFDKQLFVGDQANSIVVRCFLEKVDGEYQGACFPFRKGFQCGVMRMCWGKDGSMFCGQTARGWGSAGGKPHGLQRLVWTGIVPFEMHEVRAMPDGFTVTFTQPVDPQTAGDVKSYRLQCWTYNLHSNYGCNPMNTHALQVKQATVAADGKSVRLMVDGLKEAYVQELRLEGVRSREGVPLLHQEAYYTLNKIPTP